MNTASRKRILLTLCCLALLLAIVLDTLYSSPVLAASPPENRLAQGAPVVPNDLFRRQTLADAAQIGSLLKQQGSPLAVYETSAWGYKASAADLILNASVHEDWNINPELILVLLEMRWGIVKGSALPPDSIDKLDTFASTAPVTFPDQVLWLGEELQKRYSQYEGTPDAASRAIEEVLGLWSKDHAKLADFGKTYTEVFGRSIDTAMKTDTTDWTPVFRKPFDGFFPVNSFMDHTSGDSSVTRTDNRTLSGTAASCTLGYSCYAGHTGIDYGMAGTTATDTIRAATNGTITTAGTSRDLCSDGVYRNATRIMIRHGNGLDTRYWHLSSIGINPRTNRQWAANDTINDGEVIGQSGSTGCSTGEHLHFWVVENGGGNVDPYGFFGDPRQQSLFRSNTSVGEGDNGFQRFGPESGWRAVNVGDGGRSLWTGSGGSDYQNWAVWGADIPTTGQYEVLAFIPADVAADQMATGVTYKVLHRDGVTPLTRNQSDNRGRWMSLGTYWFNAHGAATVLITDYTTGPSGKRLYVDTVKWVATSANQPPAAPSNLRATAVSSSQIRLDWNDNSNNETSFEIYDGDKFVVSVGANTTSYTVGGLAPQSYHCHHLFARNSYGNSAWTDWGCTYTLAAGSAPAAPSNLRATAVSSSQIRLDWNDNSNNETSFEIYDGDKFVVSVGANTTSYTVGGLAPQSYHCHHLLARNSYGNSAWTDWGCTYTFAGSNSSNLARGQDANAANVEQDDTARFGPRNVTDGSTGTRWSSKQQYEGGSESDWIWVSLGGWYNVNRVILRWEAAYARMYTLKIWDGNTWVTVDTNNSGQGGVEQRTFATRNTCCVLMQGVKKANVSWGYSLWEFEVYGPVANKTGEEGLPARIDAPPGARMPNPAIDIPKPDTLPDLGK